MMKAIPVPMSAVKGSLNRIRLRTAVAAMPAAAQMPYATPRPVSYTHLTLPTNREV